MELFLIILFSILFELLTAVLRLRFRLKSSQWQKALGIPRIHHGYIGIILLLASYGVYASPEVGSALWVLGWALVISDLVHHYTVLPLLRVTHTDIGMSHYGIKPGALQRKFLIAFVGVIVVATLSSIANSLWIAALSFVLIYISENVRLLLVKMKAPSLITQYF